MGLLSILAITWIVVFSPNWTTTEVVEKFILLTVLINFPHFMSTYILMYSSPFTVKNYRWSSTWIPLILLVYGIFATISSAHNDFFVSTLTFTAGAYLAWHYTGQTWGMIAVFSRMTGSAFSDRERMWVRLGLKFFLAFHLWWFLTVFLSSKNLAPETMLDLYPLVSGLLIGGGILFGTLGYGLNISRLKIIPDVRVLIPFVAVSVWYVAMSVEPKAIFWVQIGHSIQYLMFPLRIEINDVKAKKERFLWWDAIKYLTILTAACGVVFGLLPWLIDLLIINEKMRIGAKESLVAFVNIHHFFADGAIWKVSNPDVRKKLFFHLK